MKLHLSSFRRLLAVACLAALPFTVPAAESEQALLDILKSSAPAGEKAIACKKLAVFGSEKAVPALAALLANPELSSWARIGLEPNPGPAASLALRAALDQVQGRLLVGVINSIGVRRDPQAVDALGRKLSSSDREVADAAANALGRVGGDRATEFLVQALAEGAATVRPAAGQGLILAAERYLRDGNKATAARLYSTVREAKVPKQRQLEATRGLILASGDEGVPLLIEQLRSEDNAFFGIGLRTARELPGSAATAALAEELKKASPERQPMILLALADRGDSSALPTITEAAKTGSKPLRLAAISVLEKSGTAATVPVLLSAATDSAPELANSAKASLVRLPGNDIDPVLVKRLGQSSGKEKQVLLELAGLRQIKDSVPMLLASARDTDAKTRAAAVQSLGILGGEKEAGQLVALLKNAANDQDRSDMEAALLAMVGRAGPGSAPVMDPLVRSENTELRLVGLHALAAAGGPAALSTITSAAKDTNESVRDEAVRTLSTWPNTWPEDGAVAAPLLDLAKSSTKTSYQVLAVRGYLQYVQGDRNLKGEDKLKKVSEVLPALKRPEEKRLAIAVISGSRAPGMLAMLSEMASDAAVGEEACSAIVSDSSIKAPGIPKEELKKALETAKAKSTNDATRRKAEQALGQ